MQYSASYINLETIAPGIDIDPANINPGQEPPTSFTDEPWSGGTTINISGPAYSAGLSKRSVPLPANVSQFTLTYQISPSEDAIEYSQVHETDLMIVDSAGNRYNGSTQKNNQAGGIWEIANAAGDWVPTGFKPGLFRPGVWTAVLWPLFVPSVWRISLRSSSERSRNCCLSVGVFIAVKRICHPRGHR